MGIIALLALALIALDALPAGLGSDDIAMAGSNVAADILGRPLPRAIVLMSLDDYDAENQAWTVTGITITKGVQLVSVDLEGNLTELYRHRLSLAYPYDRGFYESDIGLYTAAAVLDSTSGDFAVSGFMVVDDEFSDSEPAAWIAIASEYAADATGEAIADAKALGFAAESLGGRIAYREPTLVLGLNEATETQVAVTVMPRLTSWPTYAATLTAVATVWPTPNPTVIAIMTASPPPPPVPTPLPDWEGCIAQCESAFGTEREWCATFLNIGHLCSLVGCRGLPPPGPAPSQVGTPWCTICMLVQMLERARCNMEASHELVLCEVGCIPTETPMVTCLPNLEATSTPRITPTPYDSAREWCEGVGCDICCLECVVAEDCDVCKVFLDVYPGRTGCIFCLETPIPTACATETSSSGGGCGGGGG